MNDEYFDFVAQQKQRAQGQFSAMDPSLKPDQAARSFQLQGYSGVPAETIGGDPKEFDDQFQSSLRQGLVAANPHLTDFVNNHPLHAQLIKEDLPGLDRMTMSAITIARRQSADDRAQNFANDFKSKNLGWEDVPDALLKGLFHFGQSMRRAGTVVAGGRQAEQVEDHPAAAPYEWGDLSNLGSGFAKTAYRMANAFPSFTVGLGVTGLTENPIAGVVAGGLSVGLLNGVQALGDEFQRELAKSPEDPEGAYNRALLAAGTSGAFSGVGWGLFPIRFLNGPVKSVLFQVFGVQPAVGAAHRIVQGYQQGIQPSFGEGYAEDVVGSLLPLLLFEGVRGGRYALRPGTAFRPYREGGPGFEIIPPEGPGPRPQPSGRLERPATEGLVLDEEGPTDMTRRGFLQGTAALATRAALPRLPMPFRDITEGLHPAAIDFAEEAMVDHTGEPYLRYTAVPPRIREEHVTIKILRDMADYYESQANWDPYGLWSMHNMTQEDLVRANRDAATLIERGFDVMQARARVLERLARVKSPMDLWRPQDEQEVMSKAQQADENKGVLDTAVKDVNSTQLKAIAPDKLNELISALPSQNLRIRAEAIAKLYNALIKEPDPYIQGLMKRFDQSRGMTDSITTGSNQYIANIPEDIHKALSDDVAVGDDLTVNEAKELEDAQRQPLPEHVFMPAIRVKGQMFEDHDHQGAYDQAIRALEGQEVNPNEIEEGYSTTQGRFITPQEALKIAQEQNQLRGDAVSTDALAPGDLHYIGPKSQALAIGREIRDRLIHTYGIDEELAKKYGDVMGAYYYRRAIDTGLSPEHLYYVDKIELGWGNEDQTPVSDTFQMGADFAEGKQMLTESLDKLMRRPLGGNEWVNVPETGEGGQGLYWRYMPRRSGLPSRLTIANVQFDPSMRGTGAFRAYFDHIERLAAERGINEIHLENIENERLIPFYESKGYTIKPDPMAELMKSAGIPLAPSMVKTISQTFGHEGEGPNETYRQVVDFMMRADAEIARLLKFLYEKGEVFPFSAMTDAHMRYIAEQRQRVLRSLAEDMGFRELAGAIQRQDIMEAEQAFLNMRNKKDEIADALRQLGVRAEDIEFLHLMANEGLRMLEEMPEEGRDQIRDVAGQVPEAGERGGEVLDALAPKSFYDRLWDNYIHRYTPEEMLESESLWGGSQRMSEYLGITQHEAFARIANEMFERMGLPRRLTPTQAKIEMARQKGIRLLHPGDEEWEGPRGQITMSDLESFIELFSTHTPDTIGHEFAHLMIRNVFVDARRPGAQQKTIDLRDDFLEWLGHPRGSIIDPTHLPFEDNERGAEGMMEYMKEGQSPSLALTRVFEYFKDMLVGMYGDISSLDLPMSDSARNFFQRIIATDEEIRRVTEPEANTLNILRHGAGFDIADIPDLPYEEGLKLEAMIKNRNTFWEDLANNPLVDQWLQTRNSAMQTATIAQVRNPAWRARRLYTLDGRQYAGDNIMVPLMNKTAEAAGGPDKIQQGRIAIVIVGPPGAGKSTSQNAIAQGLGARVIDVDDIRTVIPEYKGGQGLFATLSEGTGLTLEVMDRAMRRGDNLIHPIVGAKPEDSFQNVMTRLDNFGYSLKVVHVWADPDILAQRIIARFLETGRIVRLDYAAEAALASPKTYERLKEYADEATSIDTTDAVWNADTKSWAVPPRFEDGERTALSDLIRRGSGGGAGRDVQNVLPTGATGEAAPTQGAGQEDLTYRSTVTDVPARRSRLTMEQARTMMGLPRRPQTQPPLPPGEPPPEPPADGGGGAPRPPAAPPSPPFTEGAAFGRTQRMYRQYLRMIHQRDMEDVVWRRDRARRLAERLNSREWEETTTRLWPRIEAEVRNLPEVQAYQALTSREVSLNRGTLTPEQIAQLPRTWFSNDGVAANDLANYYGYDTGDELIEVLSAMRRATQGFTGNIITRMTKARVYQEAMEELGDTMESRLEEVEDHALSLTQMEMLHERMFALGLQIGAELPLSKSATDWGVYEVFQTEPFRNLKADRYLREAGRQGRLLEQAHLAGNTLEAFRAAQAQYIAASKAKLAKTVEREIKVFGKVVKKFRTREVEGVDVRFTNFIHDIMLRASAGIVNRDEGDLYNEIAQQHIPTEQTFHGFLTQQQAQGNYIPSPDFLLNPAWHGNIQAMNIRDARGVMNTIRVLAKVGRELNKVVVAGERRDLNEVVDSLVTQLGTLGPGVARSRFRSSAAHTFLAAHLQMESLFNRWAYGQAFGEFNQVLRPMVEAANEEASLDREISKAYRELPNDLKSWQLNAKVPNNLFKDPVDVWEPTVSTDSNFSTNGIFNWNKQGARFLSLTKKNLRAILLNAGNPDNLQRFAAGYGVEQQQVMDWLFQNTTKEDWDWAQAHGKIFAGLKTQSDAMYRRLNGVAPETIPLYPIQTPFGVYEGWYHPVIHDEHFYGRWQEQNGVAGLFAKEYVRAGTPQGYTKSRTGYRGPLSIELDAVPGRMWQEIHDITFREAIVNTSKIFYNTRFRNRVAQQYGKEYSDLIVPWLEDVANTMSANAVAPKGFEQFMNFVRENIMGTLIGFNLRTVQKHFTTAAFNSIAEVPARDMLSATFSVLGRSPQRNLRNWRFALENSLELQRRHQAFHEHISGAQSSALGKYGPLQAAFGPVLGHNLDAFRRWMLHAGTTPVAFSDLLSAVPVWLAAYKQVMDGRHEEYNAYAARKGYQGPRHADAVYFADRAVRRAHGSTAVTNRPHVMRERFYGPFGKLIATFYSFFNHMGNRQYELGWRARVALGKSTDQEAIDAVRKGTNWWWLLFVYMVVPTIVEELVTPAFDWEHKSWGQKIAQVAGTGLINLSSSWLGVRDLVHGVLGGGDANLGLGATPIKAGQQMYRDLNYKGYDPAHAGKTLKHANTMFGIATGLSNTEIGNMMEYIHDLEKGVARPRTSGDWWRGMTKGEIHPREDRPDMVERFLRGIGKDRPYR